MPGAPVKLVPERETVCAAEEVPVVKDPKELIAPRERLGVGPAEQEFAAVPLLRGITFNSSKSVLLLLPSVQPLFLRNMDWAVVIPVAEKGDVSEQLAVLP